jgi:hypothetical protein
MAQIGQPVRRYTVVPLVEPVGPTNEPVLPPPPAKVPGTPAPVIKPEPQPANLSGESSARQFDLSGLGIKKGTPAVRLGARRRRACRVRQ